MRFFPLSVSCNVRLRESTLSFFFSFFMSFLSSIFLLWSGDAAIFNRLMNSYIRITDGCREIHTKLEKLDKSGSLKCRHELRNDCFNHYEWIRLSLFLDPS